MKPQTPNEDKFPELKSTLETSSVSSPIHVPHEIIEARMNDFIKSLGLKNWQVILQPDETQKKLGRIIPETRTILIHNLKAKATMRTLLHEIIELKLRPASNVERSLSNALIEWANTQVYKAKERAIEDILDLLVDLVDRSDELRDLLEGARTG